MEIEREVTTPNQIDIWRAAPSETHHLEFKEAKTQYDNEKLFEYCVALANEGRGKMLLGVSNALPRSVVGTKAFNDPFEMEAKLFATLGFRVDIEEVSHPDGRVLVFHIPSRARGTAFNRKGAYLMRCGSSLVPMSEDQLRKIFAEGKPSWLDEYTVKGLSSADVVELLHLQAYFGLLSLPFTSVEAAVDRLKADHLIDEVEGRHCIPRFSALLLARDLGLFPDLERKKACHRL